MATIAAAETALIKAGAADLNSMDISEQWPGDCKNGFGCAGGDSEPIAQWLIGRGGVLVKDSDYPTNPNYGNLPCKDDLTYWNPGYKLLQYFYKTNCGDEGE